jgi:hypothetical protein
MQAQPIPLNPSEGELVLAEIFGNERGMMELTHKCGHCGQYILVADNSIWLDAVPLKPDDEDYNSPLAMGIMKLGPLRMAAGGNIDGGSRHLLHEHQPPEQD